MHNKNKIQFRQNTYNTSDSGIMFLLALIVPQFLMIVVMLACSAITKLPFSSPDPDVDTFVKIYPTFYMVLAGLVPQISMLASFLFISERKKVNYAKANKINVKKFNWLVMLIVLAIGAVCLFGFTPFVNWFDGIVKNLGYKSSLSILDVSSAGKFIGAIFYVGLLPAICEELVFRGVITNGLKQNGTKVAVILSAVLFALMHQNLQQFVYQLFLGGVMAYIVLKTGNILYTMIWHFINNFVILLDNHINGISTAQIDFSNAWNNIYPFILVILAVCAVIGILVLLNFVLKKQKNKNVNLTNEQISISKNVDNIDDLSKKIDKKSNSNDIEQSNVSWFKNPFLLISLIAGILLWVFGVASGFLS